MSAGFKNALCLASPPGAGGGYMEGYWYRCHRHNNHPMPHRSRSFEWSDGDRDVVSRRISSDQGVQE